MSFTLGQLVALWGGSSVVVVGVSSWLSQLISERIVSKWRRDEQTTIEILRSALARDKLLLESATKGFQTGQDAGQPKRLAAIEKLWIEVLRLREEFSQAVFFCSLILPDEYDSILRDRKDLVAQIAEFNVQSIAEKLQRNIELESERPFFGETLWLQFFIYRAFLCRLALVLSGGVQKGRLTDWRQDKGIRQILGNVLSSETTSLYLEQVPFTVAINQTVSALESSMLKEISLIVSGRLSSFESFENAKDLRNKIASLDSPLGDSINPNFR
ncbi:MAG TPA: hypothetical protein VHX20_06935 [Terracidiphilus sp.]|nr:hypothetical protein [Terracidiphilus sp.]